MKILYLFLSLMVACIFVTACIAEETEKQSEINISAPQSVNISQILENASVYADQSIEVSGKITSQCGSGCWFIMSDDSGDLYVTLKPNNFVIPPAMGRDTTVIGKLVVKDNDASLIGSSMLLDGITFP